MLYRFQSTPPARGGDTRIRGGRAYEPHFNPRPPRGGRPGGGSRYFEAELISIHAPREGGDHGREWRSIRHGHFNPRPPRGGRHHGREWRSIRHRHFNPRPPRGGRRNGQSHEAGIMTISIHAPREGGDRTDGWTLATGRIFQSTPPARGATNYCPNCGAKMDDFNPRPPRGGRPEIRFLRGRLKFISIHAPREGGDTTNSFWRG